MKIALGSDEPYPVHATLVREIEARGHEIVRFGSFVTGVDAPWASVAEQAALAVAEGRCDEAVLLCWTGTGISMAANKIGSVRAALCTDATTAAGARLWNHANVLCLSNRLLSEDLCKEILAAWFAPYDPQRGASGVTLLGEVEQRALMGRPTP